MKTSIRTIIFAAAAIFAAVSCQKESAVSESQAGETIQVNITASFGDLTAADATKATAESVVRLKWTAGDKVQAYCGETKISDDDDLTVAPSENGMFASLTGTITPPNSGEIITFVYSNGCTADGLGFTFNDQTTEKGIPFVAYGTLVYDESEIEGKMVGFKFASSVMKIAASNLGGGAITSATITGINNKLTLVPSANGEPEITSKIGILDATVDIKTTNVVASSDGTKAIITVGLVPDSNPTRSIAVNQTDYTNKGVFTSAEIESSTSYTTPVSLFPCGKLNDHDYVLIAGTKWATQNLYDGNAYGDNWWSGTNYRIGDYFQWGTYENYTETDGQSSNRGLLIYYNIEYDSDDSETIVYKVPRQGESNYQFSTDKSPFYSSSNYSKYNDYGAGLAQCDDAANILWGSTWRMPTSAEFKALTQATYWEWNDEDKGYYVYAPQPGDAGTVNKEGASYEKGTALLFFPAAGYAKDTATADRKVSGNYWSSNVGSLATEIPSSCNYAQNLNFNADTVTPQSASYRCYGMSIRPVSD